MKPGEPIRTRRPIRSMRPGITLPREGTFVREIENLGRVLMLVNFGSAGEEYVFPDDVEATSTTAKAA